MIRRICSFLFFLVSAAFCFGENPILVFDAYNGYPSGAPYRIEIRLNEAGYVSEIFSKGGEGNESGHVSYSIKGSLIEGKYEDEQVRWDMEFTVEPTKITSFVKAYEKPGGKYFASKSNTTFIKPQPDVLFENKRWRFLSSPYYDLVIYSKETKSDIYKFYRNTAINEGWFKSDWKTVGDRTTLREFVNEEQYSEDWIDAGRGTIIGDRLNTPTMLQRIVNYCLIAELYESAIFFIPHVLGLKTGSY